MDPLIIISIIRGLIRVGKVGADAYEQYARDRGALLPDVDIMRVNITVLLDEAIANEAGFKEYLEEHKLIEAWKKKPISQEADLSLRAALIQFRAEKQREKDGQDTPLSPAEIDLVVGGTIAVQWKKGMGPVGPLSRVLLTLADVGLEYVGTNPGILGVGTNEEKLIGALALNLAEILPDAVNANAFGPKEGFGERLMAQFLGASLKTLGDNPDLIFSEKHLQNLVKSSLPPIVEKFPVGDITKEANWVEVMDALTGPAATAALKIVGEQPDAFFGHHFESNQAVGAITASLILSVSETGLDEQFTKEGALALLHAAVKVAAERPELFLPAADPDPHKDLSADEKRRNEAARKTAQDLIKAVAGAIGQAKSFDKDFASKVAATALDTLGKNAPAFFNKNDAWETVLAGVSVQIIAAFEKAAEDQTPRSLTKLFSQNQLIEFARIVLEQAAKTPNMIAPGNNAEVSRIIAALARAMSADTELLLTQDHWLQIFAVAAEEAAKNPGALFGIDKDTANGELAEIVIRGVLGVAAKYAERKPGMVLFGDTLCEVIVVTLRRVGGNSDLVLQHKDQIRILIENLVTFVAANAGKYGSKEWLRLFKILIGRALNDGKIPELTEEYVKPILEGKVTQ